MTAVFWLSVMFSHSLRRCALACTCLWVFEFIHATGGCVCCFALCDKFSRYSQSWPSLLGINTATHSKLKGAEACVEAYGKTGCTMLSNRRQFIVERLLGCCSKFSLCMLTAATARHVSRGFTITTNQCSRRCHWKISPPRTNTNN